MITQIEYLLKAGIHGMAERRRVMGDILNEILYEIADKHGTKIAVAVSNLVWAGVAVNNVGLTPEEAVKTYSTDKAKEVLGL